MNNLSGKKLLIVSSDSSDVEFVKTARELGLYVVCCDRYADREISPAKALADDAWDINYADTEEVARKCREEGIDGVIAGYGEDRVLAACRISNAIGKPFYATEEQIQITRNKRLFKEICAEHGVKTPKEFCRKLPMTETELAKITYPVIVKPSDNGGRKGISVCETEEELLSAVEEAAEYSKTGEVVVEEYIRGTELCAVYTMADGKISLSCLNDKYISQEEGGTSRLCALAITPSRYYEQYMREADPGIRALLKEIGAKNGVANFQLIVSDDGIKAFEMGYRVNGNNDYKVIRKYNGIDFMKMLLSYSITGSMGDTLEKDDPLFPEYYCTLVILLRKGVIGRVDYSGLTGNKNIDDISIWRKPGDIVLDTGTNTHKAGMIKFSAKTIEEMIDLIHEVQKNVTIEDENGNDMLLMPFDTDRLLNG